MTRSIILAASLCLAVMPHFSGTHASETETSLGSGIEPTPIPAEHDPCHRFATEDDFVGFNLDLQLEGITIPLRVPKIYMEDRWKQKEGVTSTAFLFRVGIGDFDPVTRAETSRRIKQRVDNWMNFLLNDLLPMERLVLNRLRSEYRWTPKKGEEIPREPSRYGLFHIPPPVFARDISREILVDQPTGTPNTLLRCSLPVPKYANPQCSMIFEQDRITVLMGFSRPELPNWRQHRDRVARFLSCAISAG
ncbi:MAG: hypothetical protein AAGC81_18295 [Pseudomonadota bacterium]